MCLCLLGQIAFSTGCAHTAGPRGRLVSPYYRTVVEASQTQTPPIPVSLRILRLDKADPKWRAPFLGSLINWFPLVAFAGRSLVVVNMAPGPSDRFCGLGEDEVETIITEEIQKSGLVREVAYQGAPQDFDFRGNIKFEVQACAHCCGLGALLWAGLSPASWFGLPAGSAYYSCDAYFEISTSDGKTVIWSKRYTSLKTQVIWLFGHGGSGELPTDVWGKELLPVVIRQMLVDLRDIPPSTWTQAQTRP